MGCSQFWQMSLWALWSLEFLFVSFWLLCRSYFQLQFRVNSVFVCLFLNEASFSQSFKIAKVKFLLPFVPHALPLPPLKSIFIPLSWLTYLIRRALRMTSIVWMLAIYCVCKKCWTKVQWGPCKWQAWMLFPFHFTN